MRPLLVLFVLLAACDHHKHPRSQPPSGEEWRVPAEDQRTKDAGAPAPAPSAAPSNGEIHI